MSAASKLRQKEIRSNASLELKLTIMEWGRRFWLLVSTDILIIILFFAGLATHSEWYLKNADLNRPLSGHNLSVTEADGSPSDYQARGWMALKPDKKGIIRDVWFYESYHNRPILTLEQLRYTLAVPVSNEKYLVLTFTFYDTIIIFEYVFAVLLSLEALGLLTSAFKIRHSIRRALRPIYDLTLAAQNMNVTANPAVALPDAQELHLSGAIDTLNNITENDLDRRIVISDERAELRGLASAINSMLDRLDAAYSSQLRFVSDASHELRTPIAVIQGYANLLDRWGKNDTVTLQESIDAIKSEAAGMQDLVEQLLFLARSDNSSIVLSIETVDISALADEVFRETKMIDPSHEFFSNLNGSLKARGDIQLLKQALRIFVDNAIKYTPTGGRITLSTFDEPDYVKVSVSDNGIGIPSEDLSRVFDRFFRADESRARETGGTGLGLSIAKWIIDRHGGFVEIISREDIGTKINVALPKYTE